MFSRPCCVDFFDFRKKWEQDALGVRSKKTLRNEFFFSFSVVLARVADENAIG